MAKTLSIISLILSLAACCAVVVFMVKGQGNNNDTSSESAVVSESSSAEEQESALHFVMYVGTNDKDTYKQEIPTEEAKKLVDEICLKYFEGYTIQDAVGAWTEDTGAVTHENSIVCYFDFADEETVHKAADEILKALNQSSVLIEKDTLQMEYYSGN